MRPRDPGLPTGGRVLAELPDTVHAGPTRSGLRHVRFVPFPDREGVDELRGQFEDPFHDLLTGGHQPALRAGSMQSTNRWSDYTCPANRADDAATRVLACRHPTRSAARLC